MNKGSLGRNLFIPILVAELGREVKRPSKMDLLAGVKGQVHYIADIRRYIVFNARFVVFSSHFSDANTGNNRTGGILAVFRMASRVHWQSYSSALKSQPPP
jgi:hypothetical protein